MGCFSGPTAWRSRTPAACSTFVGPPTAPNWRRRAATATFCSPARWNSEHAFGRRNVPVFCFTALCLLLCSRVEWRHLEAVQTKRKSIEVRNYQNESVDALELKDRVTRMCLGWDRLVVATTSQCCIYRFVCNPLVFVAAPLLRRLGLRTFSPSAQKTGIPQPSST